MATAPCGLNTGVLYIRSIMRDLDSLKLFSHASRIGYDMLHEISANLLQILRMLLQQFNGGVNTGNPLKRNLSNKRLNETRDSPKTLKTQG